VQKRKDKNRSDLEKKRRNREVQGRPHESQGVKKTGGTRRRSKQNRGGGQGSRGTPS